MYSGESNHITSFSSGYIILGMFYHVTFDHMEQNCILSNTHFLDYFKYWALGVKPYFSRFLTQLLTGVYSLY